MTEKTILNEIQLKLSSIGARLLRNNVGLAWQGRVTKYTKQTTVKVGPTDVVIRQARPVKYGLCVGSSDLIGWTPIIVTQDMVGQQIAVFTALEVKAGRTATTKEQIQFVTAINQAGGKAGIVHTVDEAAEVVAGW